MKKALTPKVILVLPAFVFLLSTIYFAKVTSQDAARFLQSKGNYELQISSIKSNLAQTQAELVALQNSDQIQKNKQLLDQLSALKTNYQSALDLYNHLLTLKESNPKIPKLDISWADILFSLSKGDATASAAKIASLSALIKKTETDLIVVAVPTPNLPVNNTPPANGFAHQLVNTNDGSFVVDVISADLRKTKVIVDTAADSNCQNNCPVMALGDFAKRKGAYAAINGPYFCPDTYPACADKRNSFDTLLMNASKTYFNSDNNVYSQNPVAIFSTTSRFVTQGLEWGRDTSVDAVIMSRPLLVFNNEVRFFGNSDTKETIRNTRAFIGATDNMVYIGIVHNVTVAQLAQVVSKLGIRNALNLDSGGSTAFWVNGKYLAGPGRNLPFGILLVNR